MESEPLCYDAWIEDALRTVIRRALVHVAAAGLPGDHHFYLTFLTDADGVDMPAALRAEHPDEMTIVLQHQFEDLAVDEDAFAVTLRFGGKPQRLRVPFSAVTSFADPGVNFGLQIKTLELADVAEPSAPEAGETAPATGEKPPADKKASAKDTESGEIIALDSFRKK